MQRKAISRIRENQFTANHDRGLLAFAFLALSILSIHSVVAYDLWWQVKTGEWILQHGWPHTDPFSFGFPDQPWIELRWLYCIIIWIVFQLGGINLLILFKCGLLIATALLLCRLTKGSPRWISAIAIAFFIAAGHDRFTIRPELVTFLLIAAFYVLIEKHRKDGKHKWLYIILVLQLIWANTHTLFILGPVLILTVATGYFTGNIFNSRFIRREATKIQAMQVAICAAASAAISLLTPYFIDGLVFPFRLFGQIRDGNVLDEIISEFVSPWQTPAYDFLFFSYFMTIVFSACSFLLPPRKIALSRLLVWGSFLLLSCLAWRNVALFSLVSAIIIILNLFDAYEHGALAGRKFLFGIRCALWTFFAIIMLMAVTNYIYRSTEREQHFGFGLTPHLFPITPLAFIKEHNLPRPVFTSLGDAGYVIFEGGEKSVFIDGRLEVYTPAQIAESVRILTTGVGFIERASQLGVHTVVLRINDQLPVIAQLLNTQDWIPVYYDMRHVVFVQIQNEETRRVAESLQVDWNQPLVLKEHSSPVRTTPRSWLRDDRVVRDHNAHLRLARLLLAVGQTAAAKEELKKAIDIRASEDVLLYLGALLEAENDPQGRKFLAQINAKKLARPDVSRVRAEIASQAGRNDLAAELMQQVIALPEATEDDYLRLAAYTQRTDLLYAIGVMKQSTARFPSHSQNWNNLARLQMINKSFAEARQALEKSLSLDPAQAETHHLIGVSYLQENNFAAAEKSLRDALVHDPSYLPAKEILRQLEEN